MVLLRSTPIRVGAWILLCLAILGLGTLGGVLMRPPSVERVLIVGSQLDSQGHDLGPGLETLLSDLMEVMAETTVTHAQSLPHREELTRLPSDTRLLRLQGQREGDQLAMLLEWNTVSGHLAGKPWRQDTAAAQEPMRIMEHIVQHWPLTIRHRHLGELIPRSTAGFWALLEGMSISDDLQATAHLGASQQLVDQEPHCATAWATLGDHLYRSLWVSPEQAGIGLNSRTHHAFRKAVERIPGHPRATFLWSLMLTDTGNQGLALQNLQEAVRLRPGSPDLYNGLAYAGRTSGLLEGARRALAQRQALLGPQATPTTWFAETTYLYLGDMGGFERELARAGSFRMDASILFYQGYFALLKGDRKQALAAVSRGSDPAVGPTPFRDLCRVYRAYLEGRPADGLAELREIDEIRGKLRIPDGEWTVKEAEAYALLGDVDHGMDCATRAFVQGFSCAPWYEASPFLAPVRLHPRWPMLRRNIRERLSVLEGSFPPSSFGP